VAGVSPAKFKLNSLPAWGNAPGFIMPKKTVNAESVIHFWHRRTSELSHRLAILRAKEVLISTSGMFGINPSYINILSLSGERVRRPDTHRAMAVRGDRPLGLGHSAAFR
jgi:hypothetical protein